MSVRSFSSRYAPLYTRSMTPTPGSPKKSYTPVKENKPKETKKTESKSVYQGSGRSLQTRNASFRQYVSRQLEKKCYRGVQTDSAEISPQSSFDVNTRNVNSILLKTNPIRSQDFYQKLNKFYSQKEEKVIVAKPYTPFQEKNMPELFSSYERKIHSIFPVKKRRN